MLIICLFQYTFFVYNIIKIKYLVYLTNLFFLVFKQFSISNVFNFNSNYFNFDEDIETLNVRPELFYKFSSRIDQKKPIGILLKDIKKNFFFQNNIFNDMHVYKNFFCKLEKLDKLQKTDSTFLQELR